MDDSIEQWRAEARKKRSFEYQRIDQKGERNGGFFLDWNADTNIWLITSGSIPGPIPREFSKTTSKEWEKYQNIVKTTNVYEWEDIPRDEGGSQSDRVWAFWPNLSSGYFGVGIDHRINTIAAIVPGLSLIADLVRQCDLEVDGKISEELPDSSLQLLESINDLRKKAEKGDINAQSALGGTLVSTVPQYRNVEEGLKWLILVAKSGDPNAEYNIGTTYLQGYSGEVDKPKAFTWIEKAALKGHELAMRNYGIMLMYGEGCTKNEKIGFDFINHALKKGDLPSVLIIGQLYLDGIYVKKDHIQAIAWFILGHQLDVPGADKKFQSLTKYHDVDDLQPMLEAAEKLLPDIISKLDLK